MYLRRYSIFLLTLCVILTLAPRVAFAQDLNQIGGDLTSDLPGRFTLQLPAPNIQNEDRRQLQLSGFEKFHENVTKKNGLGPRFINASCGGCHIQNGKGPALFRRNNLHGSAMVVKVGIKGRKKDGSPKDYPGIGSQLKDHSTQGKVFHDIRLSWQTFKGKYPDGTSYSLRKPILRFNLGGKSHRAALRSLRMTPAVVGPGLLESIPDSVILERVDPKDKNKDGIKGRINNVINRETGQKAIGRFGFKASQPTTEQQSAAAFFNDMGLTNSYFGLRNNQSEVSDDALNRITVYQNLAGVPRPRNQNDAGVVKGKSIFMKIGCESCHRINMTTYSEKNPELSNQVIHPFTDLLLHDMGPGLADNYAEFSARGRDWRTTPLWGLGFLRTVSRTRQLYLHDGRARTIEEAILWHDGEASRSKTRFKKLKKNDRFALVKFLRSL